MARGQPGWAACAKRRRRAPDLAGAKPRKTAGAASMPATDSAAARALGPGRGQTRWPAAAAWRTRSEPGSLTPGVPASET